MQLGHQPATVSVRHKAWSPVDSVSSRQRQRCLQRQCLTRDAHQAEAIVPTAHQQSGGSLETRLLADVEYRPMSWKFTEDALVVIGASLLLGKCVVRILFDAVRVEEFGALAHHTLVHARGAPLR